MRKKEVTFQGGSFKVGFIRSAKKMILELAVFLSSYVDREDWKKLKGKRCVWKAITKGKRDN